jgi:predicted phosphate transport protein (TIGR00153 family)
MSIATFFSRFVPSDHRFYDRFDEVTRNLAVASDHLKKLVRSDDETEREALAEKLHDTEHQGDTLTHQIFAELNSTFVTPFDREDIHKLTSALDDVLDHMDEFSKKVVLYQMKKIPDSAVNLADILDRMIGELAMGVRLLRSLGRSADLPGVLRRLHELENEADDVFERAVAALFDKEKDNPVRLIKVKETLVALELATDDCEDVANVLESIQIKHA